MSELDKAVNELEKQRAKENAERKTRHQAACAFLKEFYECDVAPSKKLKAHGVCSAFDGE